MMALGGKTLLQRLRTAAGMGPPITTFAALPSAGSVPGQLRQLSDVNNIIVQSLGGIWRPYGGSQVLAMRILNPVTVQSLAGIAAETLGPFPGGLVRAGMQLRANVAFTAGAVGADNRYISLYAGPVGSGSGGGIFAFARLGGSTVTAEGELRGRIDILSDSSVAHRATPTAPSAPVLMTDGYVTTTPNPIALSPTINFSQPWEFSIVLKSAAETPVTITGATWSAGVATYTTSANHTLAVGDKTVIADITPTGYNVAAGAIVLSVPTTTSFTVAMAADPGVYTSGGTSSRISNMKSQSFVLSLLG